MNKEAKVKTGRYTYATLYVPDRELYKRLLKVASYTKSFSHLILSVMKAALPQLEEQLPEKRVVNLNLEIRI